MQTTTEITTRAKAFTTQTARTYTFQVDADGTIRVWDAIAGHFTLCHSLSKQAEARIRKLAR